MYTSKRNSRYLTPNDRQRIEDWYRVGKSQSWIAAEIGVAPSTISHELSIGMVEQLNGDTWEIYKVYSAQKAEQYHKWAQSARSNGLKVGNNYAYLEALQERVLSDHSLEDAISYVADSGKFDIRISKQTAYRYLRLGLFSRLTVECLPQGHRKKAHKKTKRVNLHAAGHRSIEQRLKDIANREAFGHWEMDSVVGKSSGNNESCLVLSERKSRQEIILKPKGKTAEATVDALNKLRHVFGRDWEYIFRTITCDNGSEFADQKGMEIDSTVFFWCHPQSPGERGTNENTNKLIRRKLPKGKSLAKVTPKQVHEVQYWVNDYRRSLLDGRCSNDVFMEELAKLPLHNPERVKSFFA